MTVESNNFKAMPFDLAEDLRLRLRLLDAERVKLVNALRAYEATPLDTGWAGQGLELDELSLTEAVKALLEHAEKHGRADMQAGEISETLKGYKVRTSRGGKYVAECKSPWMVLIRVLTAPKNREIFDFKRAAKNARRSDRVALVAVARKKES